MRVGEDRSAMKYTIGEFAKILGVTTDTLRVYEKRGIVSPRKDVINNYRYYTDLDCRNILMSRWYRSLDLPLKQATQLTTDSTVADIRSSVERKRRDLEREIEENRRLLVRLEEISRDFEGLDASLDRCFLTEKPGIYRIQQTRGNDLLVEDDLRKTVSRWMELLPHSFFSLHIPLAEIDLNRVDMEHNWGLALREEDFLYYGLEATGEIEFLPPCQCVAGVITTNNEEPLLKEKLMPLLDYAYAHKYRPAGDIHGRLLLSEREITGKYRTFIEAVLPVEAT